MRCPECDAIVVDGWTTCPECQCDVQRKAAAPKGSGREPRLEDIPRLVIVYSHILRWVFVAGGISSVIRIAAHTEPTVPAFLFLGVRCCIIALLYRAAVELEHGNAFAVVVMRIVAASVAMTAVFVFIAGDHVVASIAALGFVILYVPPLASAFGRWGAFAFVWK